MHIPGSGDSQRSSRRAILTALREVVGWDEGFARTLESATTEDLWVWVPAQAVAGILWRPRPTAGGIDYRAEARKAWAILRSRAMKQETLTYGDLGHALGGLHPLHDVPQVLDVIQIWCHDHRRADLTALVVSQRSRLPGRDYWRQNGWGDLLPEQQESHWRDQLVALQKDPGPESPPF